MEQLVVYTDTSVYGGVFDEDFDEASKAFFDLVRRGRFSLLVSDVCRREISLAPAQVQALFRDMHAYMRTVPMDGKVFELRNAYLTENIVTNRWADDAACSASQRMRHLGLVL